MDREELRNKIIVITGASSGFGKGAAREFARAGCSLALAARRENLIHDLARECEAEGGRAIAIPTDVSKHEDMRRLAAEAAASFGRIDVWVNDAGVGAVGRFDEVPLADHIQVIDTNLLGTIFGSYFALRQFRRQGWGTLINIASALGKIPAPYYASYTASKTAIVGLDAALRQELIENHETDIRVCTVMPMATDTPFFEHASNYTGHESVPIPPLYEPQLVIDTIVRLATRPTDEVVIGARGKLSAAAHSVMPGLVDRYMARSTHKAQIRDARPADFTRGSVFSPSPSGTEVSGGWMNRR